MTPLTAAESYLQDFHQRQVGVTSAAFAHLQASSPASSWASSYDVLTSLVPSVDTPLSVLDLPPASVDYLASHMALMLMDDIEQVVREMRRVLRPGGQFGAIVGRTFLLGEVNEVFMRVFKPIASDALTPLRFGDRRAGSEAGWRELLDAGFADVEFDDIDVPWTPTPAALWAALLDTYDIDRLDDDARQRLRSAFLDAVTPLQAGDGTIATGWGLRLVRACAA